MHATPPSRETFVPVGGARLFVREVGEGPPLVVLHGGPDFDHTYLLPELDRLAGSLRVVYYDQRGRGRSADGVRAEDVGIESDVADLDALRRHLGVERIALLGHSFGGLLAAEYAVRHPDRVSHLVLFHTAPVWHDGLQLVRRRLERSRSAEERDRLAELASTDAYRRGDISVEAEYYEIHFRAGVRGPALRAELVGRLRRHFTPETVLLAREIEERLYDGTWRRPDYDLRPALGRLDAPTLVLHGSDDLVPLEVAEELAAAIPGATLSVRPGGGHFSYLEDPDGFAAAIEALF